MCRRAATAGWSTPHELHAGECEGPRLVAGLLVLAARPEGHLTVLVREQSAVGDRAAREVTDQVFQDVAGRADP